MSENNRTVCNSIGTGFSPFITKKQSIGFSQNLKISIFEILPDVRLELEIMTAVKIKWKK